MENLSDALLIIDLQKGVCFNGEPIHQLQTLLTFVNQRIQAYRQQNKTIIFVQHCDEDLVPGTEPWELAAELLREEPDPIIQKTHANSFYRTDLQKLLQQQQIGSLEICGAQTQYCIDTTIKFAHGLGYQLRMFRNASTTFDNPFLSAQETIAFYENIWDKRFLQLL